MMFEYQEIRQNSTENPWNTDLFSILNHSCGLFFKTFHAYADKGHLLNYSNLTEKRRLHYANIAAYSLPWRGFDASEFIPLACAVIVTTGCIVNREAVPGAAPDRMSLNAPEVVLHTQARRLANWLHPV